MATGNPFTPDFGVAPPVLAGRQALLDGWMGSLAAGPKVKTFTRLLLGSRGIGKTALLAAGAEEAREAGWHVMEVDAALDPEPGKGVVDEIEEQCLDLLEALKPRAGRRIAGGSLPVVGGGLSWDNPPRRRPSLRKLLGTVLDLCEDAGAPGLLITLDELHNLTAPEASRLSSVLQRLTKVQQKRLSFAGAALPHVEYTLLPNRGYTYFHRCYRERLDPVSIHDAMEALDLPLRAAGASIAVPDLRRAAAATRGMGYAIQSAGWHMWELSGAPGGPVGADHVERAIAAMEQDVGRNVVAPVWNGLSVAEKRFLFAISVLEAPVRMKDVTASLGLAAATAAKRKRRLLREGAIVETWDGRLLFASAAIRLRAIEEMEMEAAALANDSRERSAAAGGVTARTVQPIAVPQQCGAWMPRAEARCVLTLDHKGGHRSQR